VGTAACVNFGGPFKSTLRRRGQMKDLVKKLWEENKKQPNFKTTM
jgi:hypothetical protein